MPVTMKRPLSPAKAAAARQRALSEIESAITAAAAAHRRLRKMEAAADELRRARDALVRQSALLGASKTSLSTRLGMARQSLYEILNRPDLDDGQWIDHMVDQAVEAEERWSRSGEQGTPDEYWPL